MANNLTVRDKQIINMRGMLQQMQGSLAEALPKSITPERMTQVALGALRKNPKLLDCEPKSFLSAVMEAARFGLEIDSVAGHAYLIPYKRECVLQVGYQGRIELAMRTGNIKSIAVHLVRQGDLFSYELGDQERIIHRPDLDNQDRDAEPVTHVYAVAHLMSGGIQRAVMTAHAIDKHAQRYSQAAKAGKKDSPWLDELGKEWMQKKTVLIQLCKLLPVSVEVRSLYNREEQYLHGVESQADDKPATVGQEGLNGLAAEVLGAEDADGEPEPEAAGPDPDPTQLPIQHPDAQPPAELFQKGEGVGQ